jgi:beta-glucuronidase
MRTISLNGTWKCKPDEKDIGIENEWYRSPIYEQDMGEFLDITIPNSINTLNGFEIYEGIFWHFNSFEVDTSLLSENYDYRLEFKGSNYNTKVWVNGTYLGEHDGGFTPFHFNLERSLLTEKNFIAVRTDNIRKADRIPAMSFDWFNWGGIYRNVDFLVLNKNRIKNVVVKTHLKSRERSDIELSFSIVGNLTLEWKISEDSNSTNTLYEGKISEMTGIGSVTFSFENPLLWSPDHPYLYYLKIYNTKNQKLLYETQFGVREIETRGTHLLLNKKRLFMKGVSLHEELMPYGRTIPYKERERDIRDMKALGFNALRTAHYSHDESLLEIADKEGMLILEEIPVYWACDFRSKKTFKTAARMMRELIKRDINHPSVIWWSVGNEIPIERPEVAKFMRRLMKWTRMHDDTRLVTYVSMKLFTDLTRRYADVATINFYFGWYVGSPRMISFLLDVMRTPAFNKPWIYTEFGAGAKCGFHADWDKQIKFSEERQLHVLDYSIRTFNAKDYLAGWFIWIYRDFRSFLRQNKFQEGYNRKGIVSEKNEQKLICKRLPQVLTTKRKLLNTNFLGILLWIILYPFAYILTYLLLDAGIIFGDTKTIEKMKEIERQRIFEEKKE